MIDRSLPCALINRAWGFVSLRRHAARFAAALADPVAAQTVLLRRILRRNAPCDIGRRMGFARIATLEEWRRAAPLSAYDDYAPAIERIRQGAPGVLTSDPVTRLVPTGGSSGPCKLVPYTAEARRRLTHAVSACVGGLYAQQPALMDGPAYWSISPALAHQAAPQGPVPIGFDDDADYLGGVAGFLVRRVMAVDPAVRLVADADAFRYLTALHLLRCRPLRLISVWHPSFLALLIETARQHWDRIHEDLARGACAAAEPRHDGAAASDQLRRFSADAPRAQELRRIGPEHPGAWWPRLGLVSCWADGHAWAPAQRLTASFGAARVQAKGLLATEGVVSIPWGDARPVCITSTVVEFEDDAGAIRHVGEVAVGAEYNIVITTAGGLYRYRLGDRVRVDGLVARTPSLTFLGRGDRVADLCGEKLNEAHVASVLRHVAEALGTPFDFAMLAPCPSAHPPHYVLYVRTAVAPAPDLAQRVDALLRANPQYAYARRLGQLGGITVHPLGPNAEHRYAAHLTSHGQRLGDIKPTALSTRTDWDKAFA